MSANILTLPPTLQGVGYIRTTDLIGCKRTNKPALLPIVRSTLNEWVKAGKFPAPVKLSPGVVAFRVNDVRAYLAGEWGRANET
jgi:predicted DNA-binding transcriptional regulator AlpA